MAGEVFDHVVDRFEDGHVVVLYDQGFRKAFGRQVLDQRGCLADDVPQAGGKIRGPELAAGRKLSIALPRVRLTADARHDPLPDIAA